MLNGVDGTNVSSFQFMVDYHDAVGIKGPMV
jgi:hypothetical protein